MPDAFDSGRDKTDVCGSAGGALGTCLCHLASLEQVAGHGFSFGFHYFSAAAINKWKVAPNALQLQLVLLSASLSVTVGLAKGFGFLLPFHILSSLPASAATSLPQPCHVRSRLAEGYQPT